MLYEVVSRSIAREKLERAEQPQQAELVLQASHLEAERKLRATYATEDRLLAAE